MSNQPRPFSIDVSSRISRLPPYLFARINKLKYEKRVAGIEVGIEAAVREPRLLHHFRHPDPGVAVLADGTRRRAHNALVALLFPRGCLLHMTIIIFPPRGGVKRRGLAVV